MVARPHLNAIFLDNVVIRPEDTRDFGESTGLEVVCRDCSDAAEAYDQDLLLFCFVGAHCEYFKSSKKGLFCRV